MQAISAYGVLGDAALSASVVPVALRPLAANGSSVVSRQFFDAEGHRLPRLRHGLNIIRETHSDGSVTEVKLMVR